MCTKDILVEGESIEAASGVSMAALVASAIGNGLAGCEWAIGIPGMVGGSVRGNAGCFGGEVADAIESVKIYNTRQKCFDELSNKECNFDYRESMFKKYPELVIVSAKFKLEKDTGGARKRMLDFIEERNQKQAIGTKSAGCIFKNPKNNSAGRVIDEIGCKGLRIGDAEVSRQHANFIINNNNATAKDILLLIEKIKQKIKQEKNITLQEEIVFVK